MKILLTGSNGFLGNILFNYLVINNTIFTLNRKNSDFNCDISEKVPHFNQEFDLVIHAAGKAHFKPKNREEGVLFEKVNVDGLKNLIKGFNNEILPKRFVFISSVSVYGKNSGELINEETNLNAKDYYGLSKIKSENILKNWCKDNNILLTILRLPLIVGKNPPGNLSKMINAIQKRRYFNIGSGSAKKSMVLADDIAKYILIASNYGGTYNLTDGIHPSFKEISFKIATELNQKRIYNIPYSIAFLVAYFLTLFGPLSPYNLDVFNKMTNNLTFSDELARKSFNWTPKSVLEKNII
jgi:nucleoside-diphosphate-sugar epimerase